MTISINDSSYAAAPSKERLTLRYILSRRLHAFRVQWAAGRQNRENRAAFGHLLAMDDVMLTDIGVMREDVLWAHRLPIEVNAAVALKKQAMLRRSHDHLADLVAPVVE